MKKPTRKQRTKPMYDFFECKKYIEYKLGYDIRDVLGKFKDDMVNDVEYWDYWHFICDCREIQNPCILSIDEELLEYGTEWQNKITQAFLYEFYDAEYWVEW